MHVESDAFVSWLSEEVEARGWTFNELGRRAKISSGGVSRVMTQDILPTWDFCYKISLAFRIPAEHVFRQAGLLPALPPTGAEETEAVTILKSLSGAVRQAVLDMLRAVGGHAVPVDRLSDLERQLLDQFRQLDPRWQQIALEELARVQDLQIRIIGVESEPPNQTQT